jgi:hypothetical protein
MADWRRQRALPDRRRQGPVHLRQRIAVCRDRGQYAAQGADKNRCNRAPGGTHDAVAVEDGLVESEPHLKAPRPGRPLEISRASESPVNLHSLLMFYVGAGFAFQRFSILLIVAGLPQSESDQVSARAARH